MNSEQNKQVTIRGYQCFKNGDIRGIQDLCADDVLWTSAESEYVPFSGGFRGKDGVNEVLTNMSQSIEMTQFEPQTFIAEGDKVAVTGISRATVRATGNTYDNSWVHVFTFKDGKVSRFEAFGDTAAAVKAFQPTQGASQQPGEPLRH
jgi:ketosteroid isomerase-like protein